MVWVVRTWECAGCCLEVQEVPHEDQAGLLCSEHPHRVAVMPQPAKYVPRARKGARSSRDELVDGE